MIAKRKIIQAWRFVLYLIEHPIETNVVSWRLDMKVFISVIHLNICVTWCGLYQTAKVLVWYKLSMGIVKNMLVMRDIFLKNESCRDLLEVVVTKIISMNWQVMNISMVVSILFIGNVKKIEFVRFSLNLCDRHAHFRIEEVPLSMNMSPYRPWTCGKNIYI